MLGLVRAVRNLVDNALKYGGERLSEIRIFVENSPHYHILSVSDDGVGIKKEDINRIFRPFVRHSPSRSIQGTGLGLAIVKEIAEQHKGEVWVEPGKEKGMTVSLSISKSL